MFDLASPTGFLLALDHTLRLKPGSLLFGGVPCSSPPGFKTMLAMFIYIHVLGIKDNEYP